MWKEFKAFITRGNVIDLAVGVIIGSAFTAIVKSLVSTLINPLIGIFIGGIDFSKMAYTVGSAKFKYGSFINSVISFLITAFVVFLLVKAINKIMPRKEVTPKETKTEHLLMEIRDELKASNNHDEGPQA
ncbi:MAG: large-conductance mechanosensitive channel protein MscL [Furfurilactobacillus sp.]|jgi:large conductance mechanosensitive channel|uniref:Large-conductance mechanosensitive channel n=3 Tax=Furfurilactobacillus TaxID=2767882 RepID=A0A0R1RK22_9LACO|nr:MULTISPECIES: large-conductance mechanosensitive channel protein MscL [Furfurilactobacillus]KRL57472.1 large-conductance mechanosensitive channel [Furfurilactobacillus rossiae DSM 15814]MCF6160691.1 large-conductance mechanosensitive channel protein MscL [Furfurilactobacillus milii]MCF6162923.1 large-conductance mechanosensitive channel protein MscL [Furfurilactobacillus milii]MCF6166756.1 large-conductance mechanosensitive channel protein MscL [Furfurilactobacillus rossiae]MCF6420157.1 lar